RRHDRPARRGLRRRRRRADRARLPGRDRGRARAASGGRRARQRLPRDRRAVPDHPPRLRLPRDDPRRRRHERLGDASGGDAQEELTVDPSEVVLRDPQFVLHEFEPSAEPVDRFDALREELTARPGWSGIAAVAEGRIGIANGWATSALGKSLGALYLASWLHPAELEGIDPGAYLTRWVDELQGAELGAPTDDVQGPDA